MTREADAIEERKKEHEMSAEEMAGPVTPDELLAEEERNLGRPCVLLEATEWEDDGAQVTAIFYRTVIPESEDSLPVAQWRVAVSGDGRAPGDGAKAGMIIQQAFGHEVES